MKELFKIAIEKSRDPVLIVTNHFSKGKSPTIAYANKEFLKIVGLELEEIFGSNPCKLFQKKSNIIFVREIKQAAETKTIWNGSLVVNGASDPQIIFFTIIPVYNDIDEVMYYAFFGKQIENSKEVVRSKHLDSFVDTLFAENHYFKEFSDSLPMGQIRLNKELDIVYVNKSGMDIFGLRKDTNILEYLEEQDKSFIIDHFNKCDIQNKVCNAVCTLNSGNMYAEFEYWPLVENNKIVGYAGTIQDVSREQQIAKQLSKLRNR